MVEDVRFGRLGDQWPQYAKNDRNQPGKERPMLTVNRLLQFRDRVVNEIRQNTPSIRVRPVSDGADEDTAEVLMGLIHHIQDQSNASIAYDSAVDWQVDVGIGYLKARNDWVNDTSFDQEIYIDRIPDIFKVYMDCYRKSPDGSDMKWCFIMEEIPREEFRQIYPDVPLLSFEEAGQGDMRGWFGEDSIRIAEYYWLEPERKTISDPMTGQTREVEHTRCLWAKLIGNKILELTELPCKYIPIVPVIGYELYFEGKCHISGLFRNAKDAQRLYNYFLSSNAENIALAPKAPFIGVAGQFETDPNWARAHRDALAYLEYDPVTIAGTMAPPPQRAMPPQASSAILDAIKLAENDIMQSMGIYQPTLGAQSNETSGRALLLRQKQSEIGTFHFQDNLNRSVRQLGRIVLDMIPRVYTRAQVIRILGEDGSVRTANIDPSLPTASMNTDNPAVDSIYNLNVGRYDVICDSGPSYATKRDEAASMLLSLTQANPALFNMVGDLMLKNMDWPGAEEIAKRLQLMLPPNLQPTAQGEKIDPMVAQAHNAMNQMAGQMEEMSQELVFLRDNRMLEITDKEREWFEAQTKRIEAVSRIQSADARINMLIQQAIGQVLSQGIQEVPEEQEELENMEANLPPPMPPNNGQPGGQPPPGLHIGKPGEMRRPPDIQALTGQTKPQSKE